AVVAHVDELDPGEHAVAVALRDARLHQALGHLIDEQHARQHEPRARPGSLRAHPRIRFATTAPTMLSTMMPTIGLRSSGPSGGRTRRKIRRNGSQTSRRKPITAFSPRLYGSRPPTWKNIELRM